MCKNDKCCIANKLKIKYKHVYTKSYLIPVRGLHTKYIFTHFFCYCLEKRLYTDACEYKCEHNRGCLGDKTFLNITSKHDKNRNAFVNKTT